MLKKLDSLRDELADKMWEPTNQQNIECLVARISTRERLDSEMHFPLSSALLLPQKCHDRTHPFTQAMIHCPPWCDQWPEWWANWTVIICYFGKWGLLNTGWGSEWLCLDGGSKDRGKSPAGGLTEPNCA